MNLMDFEKKHRKEIVELGLNVEVLEKICQIMEDKKISKTDLAKKMDISVSQVSRLLGNDRNLTLKSVARILFALGEEMKVITKNEFKSWESSLRLNLRASSTHSKAIGEFYHGVVEAGEASTEWLGAVCKKGRRKPSYQQFSAGRIIIIDEDMSLECENA